jgi:hypothetical protein
MVVNVIARAATPAWAAGAMFSRRNGRAANIRAAILANMSADGFSVLMIVFVKSTKNECQI